MTKQFVKVSKRFGFQRARLAYWEFFEHEDKEETAHLHFEAGTVVLEGDDAQTFRNWTETEAEEAPPTYQHTLYGSLQDTRDQKRKLTPGRAK